MKPFYVYYGRSNNLYRDLSEDIYLTDQSKVFHTINNCQEIQAFIFNEYKIKNKIKCAATND